MDNGNGEDDRVAWDTYPPKAVFKFRANGRVIRITAGCPLLPIVGQKVDHVAGEPRRVKSVAHKLQRICIGTGWNPKTVTVLVPEIELE